MEPGPLGKLEEFTELHIVPNAASSNVNSTVRRENQTVTHFNQKFSIRAIPSLLSVLNLNSVHLLPPYQGFIKRKSLSKFSTTCCLRCDSSWTTKFYAEIAKLPKGSNPPTKNEDIKIAVEITILADDDFHVLFDDVDGDDLFVFLAHPIILEQLQITTSTLVNLNCYHKPMELLKGLVLHCESAAKGHVEELKESFQTYMTKCKAMSGTNILLNQGTLLVFKQNDKLFSVVIELMDVVNALCATVDIERLAFLTSEIDEELVTPAAVVANNNNMTSIEILEMGGIGGVLKRIRDEFADCSQFLASTNPLISKQRTILLYGASDSISTGIGKSYILHLLRKYYDEHEENYVVETIDCVYLHGKKPSKIVEHFKDVSQRVKTHSRLLILVDDLDELMPNVDIVQDGQALSQYAIRIVSAFQEFMESVWSSGKQVHIVATCSSLQRIHTSLLPESNVHIFNAFIELPSTFQLPRDFLFESRTFSMGEGAKCCLNFDEDNNEEAKTLRKHLEGINLRDFSILLRQAFNSKIKEECIQSHKGGDIDIEITLRDLDLIVKDFKQVSKHNIELHKPNPVCWSDIGGADSVKSVLMETFIWPVCYHELFQKFDIKTQSGVLLYGAPGTAKTLLASAIAHESGLNFITIKGPELLSKYVGSSEGNVRDLFARAQAARPCLLFFDELESLAPRRGHDNTGVTDRVVNQLLTQLDGVESCEGVYIIAATSRPDLIDPALLRPGRIDKSVLCALPSQEEREDILRVLLTDFDLMESGVDLQRLAEETENFSGADLKALILNAQLESMHDAMSNSVLNQNSDEVRIFR